MSGSVKVLIPPNNSVWGVKVFQNKNNEYDVAFNTPSFTLFKQLVGKELFNDVNYDYEQALTNEVRTWPFTIIDDLQAEIDIDVDDFPAFTLTQLLNKDFIIIREDNKDFFYAIKQASRPDKNSQTITYLLELDVFFQYDIPKSIINDVLILKGHTDRSDRTEQSSNWNNYEDIDINGYDSTIKELEHKATFNDDPNGYKLEAFNILKDKQFLYIFTEVKNETDGSNDPDDLKLYDKSEGILLNFAGKVYVAPLDGVAESGVNPDAQRVYIKWNNNGSTEYFEFNHIALQNNLAKANIKNEIPDYGFPIDLDKINVLKDVIPGVADGPFIILDLTTTTDFDTLKVESTGVVILKNDLTNSIENENKYELDLSEYGYNATSFEEPPNFNNEPSSIQLKKLRIKQEYNDQEWEIPLIFLEK